MGKTIKKNNKNEINQELINNNKRNERELKKQYKKKQYNHNKDYYTNEEIKFSNELLKEGYRIEYIETDGNCLFRSISDQLYNHQNNHIEIRHNIMNYIQDNEEHFKLFIEDDESFDDYMHRMRSQGQWGGHPELFAASQILNVHIHVHQLDAPNFLLSAPDSIRNPTIKSIHLSYHGEYHYNSLKQIEVRNIDVDGINEALEKITISDREMIQQIKQSIPWQSEENILQEMKRLNYNFNDIIEYFIANAERENELVHNPLENQEELNTISSNITNENKRENSRTETKSKDRKNSKHNKRNENKIVEKEVISKKDKRKAKKEKLNPQKQQQEENNSNSLDRSLIVL